MFEPKDQIGEGQQRPMPLGVLLHDYLPNVLAFHHIDLKIGGIFRQQFEGFVKYCCLKYSSNLIMFKTSSIKNNNIY